MNDPAPSRRMGSHFFMARFCLAAVVVAAILFALVVAFIQLLKDAHARQVGQALEARIAAQRPPLGAGLPFPAHAGGMSYWANHKPKAAPLWDRIWNSAYPNVAGKVSTQRELDQIREIVRVICTEHGYNAELVAFFVELEGKK